MSDLPGEITKQILSAPPLIIRSTRYSLTARGRSVLPSNRLPTGSSSLEKASGWIRLPAPAAGMMPHMIGVWLKRWGWGKGPCLEGSLELDRAMGGRVLGQDAFASGGAEPREFRVRQIERCENIGA